MSHDKPTTPKFKPDFSPTVSWPVYYAQLEEGGEDNADGERLWKIRMRWARPSDKDCIDYFDAQKRAARVRLDAINRLQASVTNLQAGDAAPTAEEINAALDAEAKVIFSVDAQLATWWKGWKVDAIEGFDPDNEADRSAILNMRGMKKCLADALDQLMAGGRQKNSQPLLGR